VERNSALLGHGGCVCEREGVPTYVGALKGTNVKTEGTWDCWDIPVVGNSTGCHHLFTELLGIGYGIERISGSRVMN
jgi:hypothetical protein